MVVSKCARPGARVGCAWLALLACGCAGQPARAPAPPREQAIVWTAPLDRDHALVGRIWDVSAQRFVSEAELRAAVAGARLLVLGEKHDNPDHHALQARLLEHLVATGRRPAVAFEMLDASAQPAIERARSAHPGDSDALAAAVDWARSGWPDFALYRPLFAIALRAELPIVAAGLDRAAAMALARQGPSALDPALAQRYRLTEPLPPETHTALREEMKEAHCGLMPEAMLDTMVLVQRARDAQFAERLHAAAEQGGGVLITGNGHARTDRGVPAQLVRAHGESARPVALGLLEVQPEWAAPEQYARIFGTPRLPFDFAWFTPRASDGDPCEALRRAHPGHEPQGSERER